MGNLADRLRLGYVVDFVELRWAGRPVWPTFNVADTAIAVGALILALAVIRCRHLNPADTTGGSGASGET